MNNDHYKQGCINRDSHSIDYSYIESRASGHILHMEYNATELKMKIG